MPNKAQGGGIYLVLVMALTKKESIDRKYILITAYLLHPPHPRIPLETTEKSITLPLLKTTQRLHYKPQFREGFHATDSIKCNSMNSLTHSSRHCWLGMASFFMSVAQNHHPSFMLKLIKHFFTLFYKHIVWTPSPRAVSYQCCWTSRFIVNFSWTFVGDEMGVCSSTMRLVLVVLLLCIGIMRLEDEDEQKTVRWKLSSRARISFAHADNSSSIIKVL
jgi:hypothetical protein